MRIVLDSAAHSCVSDIDVVIPGREIFTPSTAQPDVEEAGGVAIERFLTGGRVVAAGCVRHQRIKTCGRVAGAGCETEEHRITLGVVLVGIASVRWRPNRLRGWRGRKQCARESDEKKTASRRRPGY